MKLFSKLLLFFSFIAFSFFSRAQALDDWINYSQPYFKVNVGENGVYKIEYLTIALATPEIARETGIIDPDRLQVFYRGKEIPIYVHGANDGSFFNGDYILFHGEKNNGDLDEALYEKREYMSNPYYSLFTDTSAYFITLLPRGSTQKGLRYSEYNVKDPAAPRIPYYMHQEVVEFNNFYSYGKPHSIYNYDFHYSEYKEGEGWLGPRFGYNQGAASRIESVNTLGIDKSVPVNANVELNIIGLSNDAGVYIDHEVEVRIGPTSTATSFLFDTTFEGYSIINKKMDVPLSSLGTVNTYLEFLPKRVNSVAVHGNAVGYIKLTYPREFDLSSGTYYNFTAPSSTVRNNILFSSYGAGSSTKPMVFDEGNNLMYRPTVGTGRDFLVTMPPRGKESKIHVFDETEIKVIEVEGFMFQNIRSTHGDSLLSNCIYNIITSKRLRGTEMDEFYAYKKQGKATIANVEDLYNLFSYGVSHPLAIRRYCKFLVDENINANPEYLLIIGRGFENQLYRKSASNTARMSVPTIGVPASDVMFSYDLNGTGVAPYMATGRLAFDHKYDIRNYLDKLKKYEDPTELQVWRKEVIHLGGGKDGGQAGNILGILNNLKSYTTDIPFGGNVTTFSKSASGIVSPYVKENTVNKINAGVNMVTFLGHGSTTLLDLDIGDTSDLSNDGKYPIYFFNGCSIGNPNLGYNSNGEIFYSEQVLKAKDKGGIVFIGQSSTSELNSVRGVMDNVYKEVYVNGYGESLGKNLKDALDSLYRVSPTEMSWIHATQTFYQGDPGIVSYSPSLPDYVIEAKDVFIYPSDAIALSDSFAVAVIVKNAGKAPQDTCELKLSRTYPDLFRKDNVSIIIPPVLVRDTFYVWLKSKDISTAGTNYLDIEVNFNRDFDEFTYLNNRILNKDFEMRSNGVNLIYPKPFDIVTGDKVDILVNAMNLAENPQNFIFELDTSPHFNSPFKKSSGDVQSGPLARQAFSLLKTDSTVYYWRCRLARDNEDGGAWKKQSFTNIKQSPVGWSQAHFPQFHSESNDVTQGIVIDTTARTIDFDILEKAIWIDTDLQGSFKGVKLGGGFSSKDINAGICFDGLVVMLFNKNTLELEYHPTIDPKDYCPNGDSYNGSSRQIYYNFQTQYVSGWNAFSNFIDGVEDGTYVALFTFKNNGLNNYKGWGANVYEALHDIGSVAMDAVDANDPNVNPDKYMFVCLGRKGLNPGEAYEEVIYAGLAAVEARMYGKRGDGLISSEPIGPAGEWNDAFFNVVKENGNDSFLLHVLAVRPNLQDTLLISNKVSTGINLSGIDADKYPYIRLQGDFFDEKERTPAQLINWRVTHASVPEGSINILRSYEDFNGVDTLLEGEVFNSKIAFENVSGYPFDSILVVSKFEEVKTRKILWTDTTKISALKPLEFDFYAKNIETKGLKGAYTYTVKFNPGPDQPEVRLVNNTLTEWMYVKVDELNPILDVTFDGKHIVNGDLVSAQPRILITSKDENKVLLQDDSTKFLLSLKSPGSADFVDLEIDGNEVQYFPATDANNMAMAEFNPSKLPDGEYTLRVQTYDKTGNIAGAEPYEITFKVINETSISNFYPYPNPFTSQTRFVFTLTGSEIPDFINIKILTITGKVVKEINKEDLGAITIGNNVSEYSWDATDQFGDRLANGVYLYKVTVKHDGKVVKPYATAGDGSFKQDFGKLYIMK